ncbi:MAG: hypothetical protein ACKVU0_03870 [Saprospiraceae bacterium]
MKESLKKLSPFLAILLIAIAVFVAKRCCPPEGDGSKPPVLGEPVKAPVAIAFIDANKFLSTKITPVKVSLIDPNGKVVTCNGLPFINIDISGGVMNLALKQDADISQQNPYRFTIKAEADGYSTAYSNILIFSDEGLYAPIFMAKLEDPPLGMASAVGVVSLNNGLVKNDTTLNPNKTNGVPVNKIAIEIAKGTQLIYCDRDVPNAPVPQKLNYRISYASPNTDAGRTFQAGPLVTDAIDASGNVIAIPQAPVYFATAGWMNLEMDADGKKVSGFSKPLTVTMPIPDTLPNPQTGQYYKIGDNIDVWSLSDQGVWRQESASKVEGQAGNLFAKMLVTHLSSWNLDIKQNVCGGLATPTNAIITYTNAPTNALTAYSEVRTITNTLLPGYSGRNLTYLAGGGTHTIYNFPDNFFDPANPMNRMKVQVFQNGAGTTLAAESTPFSCSTPSASLNITNLGASTETVTVAFQLANAAGNDPLCNQVLWYQPCSGGTCSGSGCFGIATSYQFGGFSSLVGGASRVTFSKNLDNAGTDFNCVRLWQGESLGGGVTQEVAIDFAVDFNRLSTTPESITAEKRVNGAGVAISFNVQHWFDIASSSHFFELAIGSITLISPCPPPPIE